jgi:hypothetical protein
MSIKQLSQNVRRGYMLPSFNSVYDGLKCCMNRENKKKPGWPLENPPPVAGSKSPTPVVGRTGVI